MNVLKQKSVNEIDWRRHNTSALSGKVVDKCAMYNDGREDDQILIITFTDGTFMCIGIGYDEDTRSYRMEDNWLTYYNDVDDLIVKYHAKRDINSGVKLDSYGELLREFGLITITDEQVTEIVERLDKERREKEYQLYLKLKEKFENK